MKLTKSGEIEACCEWIDEVKKSEILKVDPFDASGEVSDPVLRVTSLGGWFLILYLKFCPNCGAKTEIEGE